MCLKNRNPSAEVPQRRKPWVSSEEKKNFEGATQVVKKQEKPVPPLRGLAGCPRFPGLAPRASLFRAVSAQALSNETTSSGPRTDGRV
jgi:hypothetical protein